MPEQPQQGQADALVATLMKKVAGDGEDKSVSSFPATLIWVGILVVVISILGIKLAFAKRKAAELAIQIRRTEEKKKRAEEDAKLKENEEAMKEAWTEVQGITKEILGLKARMAKRKNDHQKMVAELDGITSWDDIVIVDKRDRS